MKTFDEVTLEDLKALAKIEGDHWMWIGEVDHVGTPRFRLGRKAARARLLALRCVGRVEPGLFAVTTCGNDLCVNPEHLTFITPSEFGATRWLKLFSENGK